MLANVPSDDSRLCTDSCGKTTFLLVRGFVHFHVRSESTQCSPHISQPRFVHRGGVRISAFSGDSDHFGGDDPHVNKLGLIMGSTLVDSFPEFLHFELCEVTILVAK